METVTIATKEYANLKAKAHGFDLQVKCFEEIREHILPTEKQRHLPWYDMLAECIKNRQLKPLK